MKTLTFINLLLIHDFRYYETFSNYSIMRLDYGKEKLIFYMADALHNTERHTIFTTDLLS